MTLPTVGFNYNQENAKITIKVIFIFSRSRHQLGHSPGAGLPVLLQQVVECGEVCTDVLDRRDKCYLWCKCVVQASGQEAWRWWCANIAECVPRRPQLCRWLHNVRVRSCGVQSSVRNWVGQWQATASQPLG